MEKDNIFNKWYWNNWVSIEKKQHKKQQHPKTTQALNPYFVICTTMNKNGSWAKVEGKTENLIEENSRKIFVTLGQAKIALDTKKHKLWTKRLVKWIFIKIKNICS